MGLKHKKYVYVRVNDQLFVKLRVLKSRDENSPDRYILTGVMQKKIPSRYAQVIKLDQLPLEVRDLILKSL
jgi:hypothetical protein